MNKKTIIILTAIIILLLIISGVYWFYFRIPSGKNNENEQKRGLPGAGEVLPPEKPGTQPQGTPPLIQKLIKGKKSDTSGAIYILIAEENGLGDNSKYVVRYYNESPFNLLFITLMGLPLSETRKEAEEMLLKEAEGDLENLCKLRVSIGAPYFVYEEARKMGQKAIIENPQTLNICKKN